MRPNMIIFDWDNTLVDSWDIIHDSMMATFDRLKIKRAWQTKAETQKNGQHSLRDSFPKLFGCQFMRARDIYYEEYVARHLQEVKPMAEAGEALAKIASQQIPMAIISNKNHPILLAEVKHLGWQDFFVDVMGAGHATADKPNPAPFLLMMEKIYGDKQNHPAPDDIWYVGDMTVDVTFARNIGVKSVMIPSEPLQQQPDRLLKGLGEMGKLI